MCLSCGCYVPKICSNILTVCLVNFCLLGNCGLDYGSVVYGFCICWCVTCCSRGFTDGRLVNVQFPLSNLFSWEVYQIWKLKINCWQGSLGRHQNFVIWKAISHCLIWCLWRERNVRTFEGCELSVVELKLQLYRSLLD